MALGPTEWKPVTQDLVDRFAQATGDLQWIHTEPERALRESPFRRTIAHGYFTLGMVPVFFWDLVEITGIRLVINYGANKVRWPAPVPIPSRVRMVGEVTDLISLESSFDVVLSAKIEVENQKRPGMIAEVLYRYYR
ncbi:MAG: MaoC family dehydratase [Deltaproteobacteria bacterium]|nr:MaoC family dehydratase [Deltaproteobacteria bacterium]